MIYTSEYIKKKIMLAAYIFMVFSAGAGLLVTDNRSINSMGPQVFSIIVSIILFTVVYYKGLNRVLHVISILYYTLVTLSMWVFLGAAHPLGILYLILVLFIILSTVSKTIAYYCLTALFIAYISLSWYQSFVLVGSSLVSYSRNGFLSIMFVIIGISFIIAYNRHFMDKLLDQLTIQSIYDPLTHLKNRRAFNEDVKIAESDFIRYKSNYSIVYIDVDKLKVINDTYGHIVGDKVLQILSHVIVKNLRSSDVMYRFGGDEFVILFKHMGKTLSEAKMKDLCKKLLEESDFDFDISISFGTIERDGNEISVDDLLVIADKLMFEHKQSKNFK